MRVKFVFMCAILLLSVGVISAQKSFYDFEMKNIKGENVKLSDYKHKVVLVVNTASKCGLTPQYEGLEELYKFYKSKGFVVLAFPCNQFLGQEPGSSEEILSFCTNKYNISFPVFSKIDVNGDNAHPLYVYLKEQQTIEGKNDIRWNFEKFLIDKSGKVIKRYSPKTKPEELKVDIESVLK